MPDGDITQQLQVLALGDAAALDRVFQRAYGDLRRVARARVRDSPGGRLADTTGLVHEAYLRLRATEGLALADRRHFFAYASRVMRSILVDMAREQLADKRGGGLQFVTLDTEVGDQVPQAATVMVDVDGALDELARIDERMARVVEMRFFGGLTVTEVAEALETSPRTVERAWEAARSFLHTQLRG